ncbi:MAG: DUF4112 domain-containing protein [Pseudooceanicola sp.]
MTETSIPTAANHPAAPRGQQERADRIDRLDRLAERLDAAFRIPGTSIRVGWDSILGLLPGVGDVAALVPGGYIILEAHKLCLPKRKLARMGVNTGIDWAIGSVPLIGDIFDVGFKANRRNVALIREHFNRTAM